MTFPWLVFGLHPAAACPLDRTAKLWHRRGHLSPGRLVPPVRAAQAGECAMPEFLKITVQDHVATVVMNRPPVNAQHTPFREEIIAAFDAFTDRDDVRVAILTGFGKMFSAGADMRTRPST